MSQQIGGYIENELINYVIALPFSLFLKYLYSLINPIFQLTKLPSLCPVVNTYLSSWYPIVLILPLSDLIVWIRLLQDKSQNLILLSEPPETSIYSLSKNVKELMLPLWPVNVAIIEC